MDGNYFKSVALAVFDNVLRGAGWASEYWDEDEVVFMNDDFFCLDPVGSILPIKRDITLAEHVAKFGSSNATWWPASLRLTASFLADQGYPSPDSYEVHRPLVASAGGMVRALRAWTDGHPLEDCDNVPQWRTVYGTLEEVEAYPVRDGKLGGKQTGIGTPWISTSDQSWRVYSQAIRRRFQKPSRWEA